ncbi:MAG: hypothetical protein E6L00_04290 [Thaumarchaeota archaeon]|nr:MAG: hypothetical protein E6L00_04290 [Nitrososphaerota archaeon]
MKGFQLFARTRKHITTQRRSTSYLVAEQSLAHTLRGYLRKVPELNVKDENGRNVFHYHNFRKFFRTTVGNVVNRDFAEALIGHHFYLDTYYNLPPEKKLEMYQKAEPYLTISDYTKIEKDLKTMSEKQRELEVKVANLEKNSIQVPSSLLK